MTANSPPASPPDSITALVAEVDAFLDERLDAQHLPDKLLEAVRYAVLGGGKRLRPVLALLSCEAVGADRVHALPAAAAMELVHCFSLVHDDLPAMDDDELRRGRPTLHIHAGEAMAILAGDAMISIAFELLHHAPLDAARRLALLGELAHGTTRMIAGQVYDTLGGMNPSLSTRHQLDLIHRNKTGALIRASCRMGAIAGGANERQLAALTTYGDAIGLMFQIVDDVLDVTQSAAHTGKATGKDEQAGKLTFPGVLGLEASQQEVKRLRQAALQAIAPLGTLSRGAATPLAELCEYMAVRTK
jgi:geranylgeranyl diphosphate synthase, type II